MNSLGLEALIGGVRPTGQADRETEQLGTLPFRDLPRSCM